MRPAIGMMAPLTGTSAAIGADQLNWARFYVARWNAAHRRKVRLVELDTQLDPTYARIAAELAVNSALLGVVIGGRSHEITAAAPALMRAGLAFLSGSATRDSLTNGSLRGYFFRVVARDTAQAPTHVEFMGARLGVKRRTRVVIVDDGGAYSRGLADAVQRLLRARGVIARREAVSPAQTDFTALIGRIHGGARVLYAPWQLPEQAQLLGAQLRVKRRGLALLTADGAFDPVRFTVAGAYVSFFAPDLSTTNAQAQLVAAFRRRYGATGPFGAPNWLATQVLVTAIDRACRDGRVSRAEVRRQVARTRVARSILGTPLRFTPNGDVAGARFSVYRILNGRYVTIR